MAGISGKWNRNWLLLVVIALAIALGAKAQDSVRGNAQPTLTFTVYVYNFAHVSRRSLDVGEGEASRIFLKAGVGIRWVDCPLSSAEIPSFPACQSHRDPSGVVLKIFPDFSSQWLGLRRRVMGFCPASEGTGPGSETALAYKRIKDLANSWGADVRQVLGFAAAHELGHLLLHMPGHSRSGIMHAPWSPEDLRCASRGELVFAPQQCEALRAEALARRESHLF